VPDFEFTALRLLVEAEARLRGDGIELWLCDLSPEALELVRRTPLAAALGRERLHFNVESAVAAWLQRERR
jgi:sulfate permease, SulP family